MKLKLTIAIIGLALTGTMVSAQANLIDVSYTASGSPGAWTLDFSVTNNLGDTNNVYYFGVRLPLQNISNCSPRGDSTTRRIGAIGGYRSPVALRGNA